MERHWTAQEVMALGRAFQPACVLTVAAELGVFDALADRSKDAAATAKQVRGEPRGVTVLLDALTAMELLTKADGRYSLAPGVADVLTERGGASGLAMVRHLANCLRHWAMLARVVQTGKPGEVPPSVRGAEADLEAFIEAMEEICRDLAPKLVKKLGPPAFTHLLDVGGGPGTWTIAFLRAAGAGAATLFDRPEVIPIAQKHVAAAGLTDRVRLVGGDMASGEPLPAGADLAWVSAIIHMNSREENRRLFAKVHAALQPRGRILIRDIFMDSSHVSPADGAMFAVNMLVNTLGGGTYSFEEVRDDLMSAGFREAELICRGEFMDSVVQAIKGE